MKIPRNMKHVKEIVDILVSEGREATHENVSSWVMKQTQYGTHYGGRYGHLKQGDFSKYFREFHNVVQPEV